MHLADAFIQSDLQCIQSIHLFVFFYQYVCSLGIEPTTFCASNAMLYHWATGTPCTEHNKSSVHGNDMPWASNTIVSSFLCKYRASKDHWKIGESEHNTDCDVTVGITNMCAPNICITSTRPCSRTAASRTIRSSAGNVIVKKQARTTGKWQIMEINVMFQAVQGMWSAGMGWCLFSERHGKQITRSNKITRATKGTWLASC